MFSSLPEKRLKIQTEKITHCQPIGEIDDYVYDIECKDGPPNFIADNILVHNSLFFSLQPIAESCNWQGDIKDLVLQVYEHRIKDYNQKVLQEYADKYSLEQIQDFELEKIASSGIFLKKKMYVMDMCWEEGFHKKPLEKVVVKGIDAVRSDKAFFARNKIKEIIHYLLVPNGKIDQHKIAKIVRKLKNEFRLVDLEQVCMQTSVKKYNDYVLNDETGIKYRKKTPAGVKAAITYNYLIKNSDPKLNLKNKYELIRPGDKIKMYYTTNKKYPVFGFLKGYYPHEIAELVPIDYDLQYEKTILNLVNRFNRVLNLPILDERLATFRSLF